MKLYDTSAISKITETKGFVKKLIFTNKINTMITMHPQYITDHEGNKISVVLSIKEFESLLEELEEIEDIKLYDAAKASDEPSFPVDEAFKMIEEARQNKK